MAYLDKVKLADYTRKEDWLNSISHMVGGGLSVVALLMSGSRHNGPACGISRNNSVAASPS